MIYLQRSIDQFLDQDREQHRKFGEEILRDKNDDKDGKNLDPNYDDRRKQELKMLSK